MSKVIVTKDKLDYLANAISVKSGESLALTIDEMIEAVDCIEPVIEPLEITPSDSQQTFDSSSIDGYKPVVVGRIDPYHIGTSVPRCTSSNLTVSGATVYASAGYYNSVASKSVASMTLPTSASSSSSGTLVAFISPSEQNKYINIPVGYNNSNRYYCVSAIPSTYVGSNVERYDGDVLTPVTIYNGTLPQASEWTSDAFGYWIVFNVTYTNLEQIATADQYDVRITIPSNEGFGYFNNNDIFNITFGDYPYFEYGGIVSDGELSVILYTNGANILAGTNVKVEVFV